MSFLTENIVLIWLIPVALQIILPLTIGLFRTIRVLVARFNGATAVQPEVQPATSSV